MLFRRLNCPLVQPSKICMHVYVWAPFFSIVSLCVSCCDVVVINGSDNPVTIKKSRIFDHRISTMEEHFDPTLDYYEILGVSPDASTDAIRSAYVQLGKDN